MPGDGRERDTPLQLPSLSSLEGIIQQRSSPVNVSDQALGGNGSIHSHYQSATATAAAPVTGAAAGTHSGADLASFLMNAHNLGGGSGGQQMHGSTSLYHPGTTASVGARVVGPPESNNLSSLLLSNDLQQDLGRPFNSLPQKRKASGAGNGHNSGGHGGIAVGASPEDDDDSISVTTAGADDNLHNGASNDKLKKKRSKTPRACDSCRRKKIRCNPIDGAEPPICQHCKSRNAECTWFLPIAETRFKRSKPKEEPGPLANLSVAAQASTSSSHSPSTTAATSPTSRPIFSLPSQNVAGQIFPLDAPQRSNSNGSDLAVGPRKEARIVGPTSISHLMHSTSTFPTERMVPVDFKYSQSLTVDETGDGFIRVISNGDGDPADMAGGPVAIQGLDNGVAEQLINYYFDKHAQHFPVVSRADFAASGSPSILLFNALCGISALSHHVAPGILRTIKGSIRAALREQDLLDNSTIANIQALLVYSFSLELEKGTAASKTWNLLGVAIRMAQDLGLHRKLGSESKLNTEADHTELRRRVWGGCVIADRWCAAMYGQPMMIDLADCDTELPSVHDIRPAVPFDAEHRPFMFNGAVLSLSILLGRILKGIYSPTGILTLSSEDATSLIADLASWVEKLPDELRFQGPSSSPEQGFLHLLYIPVRFLVTRPFMRISFQLPERFANVSVGTVAWSKVETESREAIQWVDKNEHILEGWFCGVYSFFVCCLVQYHSHIRRRDPQSLATLRLARDTMKRLVIPEGETHLRHKIAEITHLLYHTATSVGQWAPEAAEGLSPASNGTTAVTTLNPTVGVRQREQDWHLRYRKDGQTPYFVSERKSASLKSSPGGTLVRPTATPSPCSTPATQPAHYASSIRSTHVAGEDSNHAGSPATGMGTASAATGFTTSALSSDAAALMASRPSGTASFSASPQPMDSHVAGTAPLPQLSATDYSFPIGQDALNFNPALNLPGSAQFDPFGVGGDGTPSLFPPDGIFDWDSWSSFFNTVPNGVVPNPMGPDAGRGSDIPIPGQSTAISSSKESKEP